MPVDDTVPSSSAAAASRLCTACGLCCDGTLFGHAKLNETGDRERFQHVLPIVERDGDIRLTLPCTALSDCVCAIYDRRPAACRAFRCKLLARLDDRAASLDEALARVHSTKRLIAAIRAELRGLGMATDGRTLFAVWKDYRQRPTGGRRDVILQMKKLAWSVHEYFNESTGLRLSGSLPNVIPSEGNRPATDG